MFLLWIGLILLVFLVFHLTRCRLNVEKKWLWSNLIAMVLMMVILNLFNHLVLWVWLIVTLVLIFADNIADIIIKNIGDISGIFLSKNEKIIHRQQQYFSSADPKELLPVYYAVLQKYAISQTVLLDKPDLSNIIAHLPDGLKAFFEKYESIVVDNEKIIDIKMLQILNRCNNTYIIIGQDPDTNDLFVAKKENNSSGNCTVYEISSISELEEELKPEDCFGEFVNFICFIVSHYSDQNLMEPLNNDCCFEKK